MGFFKSIKKAVKKVAKKVKDVGSKVWKGVKGAFGKVAKAFGKLGPIGTIALSMMMPGLGSAIGGWWTSTAASLSVTGAGALSQAVGGAMSAVSNGIGATKGFFGGLSDKIGTAISETGGEVFKAAQEFVGIDKPMSFGDSQKWFANKADSILNTQGGSNTINQASTELTASAVKPISSVTQRPSSLIEGFSPAQVAPSPLQQTIAVSDTSIAGDIALQEGFTGGTGEISESLRREAIADSVNPAQPSLINRAAKALGQSLLGPGVGQGEDPFAPFQPVQAQDFASLRGGISGRGSVGGQFLSEAQRRQQQQFAQQLGQLG